MKKKLSNLFKWIYINKFTIVGFLSLIVYGLDNYFKWSEQLKLSDEWYYVIVGLLLTLVTIAIKGRGIEKLDTIEGILNVIGEYKNNKQIAKEQTAKAKMRLKNQPLIEALKDEIKRELNQPSQPQQPPIDNVRIGQK